MSTTSLEFSASESSTNVQKFYSCMRVSERHTAEGHRRMNVHIVSALVCYVLRHITKYSKYFDIEKNFFLVFKR